MNNSNNNTNPPLHLHDDPEHNAMESLLDLLAKDDRDAMPSGLESRVLDSISAAIAPTPLNIATPVHTQKPERFWSLRLAAAAALATGTTLVIVGTRPWAPSATPNIPGAQLTLAASMDQDFDAFFALESLDDGNLSEAVSEWEIWAQSLDTEFNSSLSTSDWYDSTLDDGAL